MKRAAFPALAVLGATLVTIAWRGPPPGGAWRLLCIVIGLGILALVGTLLVVQRLVPELRRRRDARPDAVTSHEASAPRRPASADLQSSTEEEPGGGPRRERPRPPAARPPAARRAARPARPARPPSSG